MLKFKIVEINDLEHSVVVRFYTDKITEIMLATDILDGEIRRCRTDYNITLPIPAPVGDELNNFLLKFAPVDWFVKQELLLTNTHLPLSSVLTEHLNVEKISSNTEQNIQDVATSMSDINDIILQAAIQRALVSMTGDTI